MRIPTGYHPPGIFDGRERTEEAQESAQREINENPHDCNICGSPRSMRDHTHGSLNRKPVGNPMLVPPALEGGQ